MSEPALDYACPTDATARPPYQRVVHICALVTLLTTFPLIWMGGLVTSKDAGMSVPDWPNSYGYNMFTFPVSRWVGGIFYEHTHRLLGTVVGLSAIILAVAAWRKEKRKWVRWLCAGVLASVIAQGVLGGLRVRMKELDLAVVHGCMAQLFFCLSGFACLVTSRWWFTTQRASDETLRAVRRLTYIAVACVVLLIGQLAIAACMRHYKAGLAIPDFPTAFGGFFPPLNESELAEAQHYRLANYHMPPVTFAQIWLQFAHRIGAVLVSVAESAAVVLVVTRLRHVHRLVVYAGAVTLLLATQVTLGILTILMTKPADIATAHVATGALLLLTTFLMTVTAMRMLAVNLVSLPENSIRKPARSARVALETSPQPATI